MELHGAILEIKRVTSKINAYQEKRAGDKEHYLRLKFVTGQTWGLLWAELCTFPYVEVLILRTSDCDCLYLEIVSRVGKKLKQNSLFLLSREKPSPSSCVSPLLSHQHLTLTLLTLDVWGFPHQAILQDLLAVLTFNSALSLSIWRWCQIPQVKD